MDRIDKSTVELIYALWREDMTTNQIADILDISEGKVVNVLVARGYIRD